MVIDHETTMLMFEVAKEASEQTLILYGLLSEYMDRAEAYRRSTRTKVDKAILDGSLPYVMKGEKLLMKRTDFKKWQIKNYW